MKSIVLYLAIGFIVLDVTSAVIARVNLSDPKNPGKCTVNNNLVLSPGKSAKDPKQCANIACGENGNAQIQTCGAIIPPPNCKLRDFIDQSRPYPACCERKFDCSGN